MTDIWLCGTCHSINQQRSSRCYKCGAEQATAATGEMATHRQEQAIASPGCMVETYPGLASIKPFKPWKAERHRRW